jgi:hypothetical protein
MLGVTMQESGVSKIIAVRLAENGVVLRRESAEESAAEEEVRDGLS